MGRIIGIDLGTTNSIMAVIEGGTPCIIPNAENMRSTPSVVAFDQKTGRSLVGEAAKQQAINNPGYTFFSVKSYVGRAFKEADVQQYLMNTPNKLSASSNGGILFFSGKKWYTPEEILAFILRKLVKDAEQYLDDLVSDAVIIVPINFNFLQRRAIEKAGWLAGLKVVRTIEGPMASALAMYRTGKSEKLIVVCHLGGATLDISILEIGDGVFELKSKNGITNFGGDSFDRRLTDWICDKFRDQHGIDLRQKTAALQRIKESAEKAKCELSLVMRTEINLPYIITGANSTKNLSFTLERKKLVVLTKDLIEEITELCKIALRDADVTINNISEVILVGQQTRMPAVKNAIKEFFGKDIHYKINSVEAVALGAAIQSGILVGSVKEILPFDSIPFSLGIRTLGGVMTRLVERNTTIPLNRSQIFSTAEDNQKSITIFILQGEREMAANNICLGKFVISEIPPAPRGVPQIEVTLDIDANGAIRVSAKDLGTGKERVVTLLQDGVDLDSKDYDILTDLDRMMNDNVDDDRDDEVDSFFEDLSSIEDMDR